MNTTQQTETVDTAKLSGAEEKVKINWKSYTFIFISVTTGRDQDQ